MLVSSARVVGNASAFGIRLRRNPVTVACAIGDCCFRDRWLPRPEAKIAERCLRVSDILEHEGLRSITGSSGWGTVLGVDVGSREQEDEADISQSHLEWMLCMIRLFP
ncbi:hypothetical protein VTK56DRAFT_1281 [Thermocarpiscus australiensis]